jgi:peptide/nickel transport system substrate-binding protein
MSLGILPERIASRPDLGDAVIGTGPYRIGAFRPGEEVVLQAFPEHFSGPPKIGRVKFRIVSNATTRLLEIESGGLDLLQNAVPPYSVKFLRRRTDLSVITAPGPSYQYIVYNFEDPILRDGRVRRAISHALDRGELISFALQGLARPASGLLPPEHWAYSGLVPVYAHEPARAKSLLDEAGFRDPDGDGPKVRFTLSYKTSTDKTANEVARVVAEQLRRVGIGLEVRSFEWGTFFSDIKKGSFQLASLRWIGMSDPDSFHMVFHSSSVPPAGANRGRYRNAEVDRLTEESRIEADPGRRKALYARVQEVLAWDCPYTSLWWLDNVVVLRRGFRGFRALPGGEYTSLAKMEEIR